VVGYVGCRIEITTVRRLPAGTDSTDNSTKVLVCMRARQLSLCKREIASGSLWSYIRTGPTVPLY
jgi:hypothetical protein